MQACFSFGLQSAKKFINWQTHDKSSVIANIVSIIIIIFKLITLLDSLSKILSLTGKNMFLMFPSSALGFGPTRKYLYCHHNDNDSWITFAQSKIFIFKANNRSRRDGSCGGHCGFHLSLPAWPHCPLPVVHPPVSFLYFHQFYNVNVYCHTRYSWYMLRNTGPADLLSMVGNLWREHFQSNPNIDGLKSLTEALFDIRWVAENVPRNPRTLRMMALMVRVLIKAMKVCCSEMI